jgi:hypothetical protein
MGVDIGEAVAFGRIFVGAMVTTWVDVGIACWVIAITVLARS